MRCVTGRQGAWVLGGLGAAAAWAGLAGLWPAAGPGPWMGEVQPRPVEVQTLYLRHCAACHGVSGHGDGPAAEQLYPAPRAFRDSPFRFAATGGDERQIQAALERTIREGVPRSAMPGFAGVLGDGDIAALAEYVRQLVQDAPPVEPLMPLTRVGPPPRLTPWLAAQGARVFHELGCAKCHGSEGRGDGPVAADLVDSLGRPVRPGDLASGLYKSGSRPEDLYRTIIEGVPGTPMIGYGDALITRRPDGTRDDLRAWALVAFVQSLAPVPRATVRVSGAILPLQPLPDAAPLDDPSHPAWLAVHTTPLTLRPLWQRPEDILAIDVAVVSADDRVGVFCQWRDSTCDVTQDSGRFSDAVAVMFALGDDVPALPMGVHIPGLVEPGLVNIWHWKASRQYDASLGRRHDVDDPRELPAGSYHQARYYLFPMPARRAAGAVWEPARGWGGPDPFLDNPWYQTASAAGNVHADPVLLPHAVLEANALGLGTLTYQPSGQQDVMAAAVWSNGYWFVVMSRRWRTEQESDVTLTQRTRIPVAFAVWDGSKGDRDGIKLITGWHFLRPRN